MGLPGHALKVSILMVSARLAAKWREAKAGTNEQEMAVATPEQMSKLKTSRKLDLFETTCKVLRILKSIEIIGT